MAIHSHTQRVRHEQGVVLLLSLLLIAALTAAGIGASVIIVTEFQSTRSTDQGIKAFYTADIGMERALYTVFNNRLVGTQLHPPAFSPCNCASSTETLCQLVCNNPEFSGTTVLTDAGASVFLEDTSATTAAKTVALTRENQTVQIDLYNPDSPFSPGFNDVARTIVLQRSALAAEDPNSVGAEVQWIYALKFGQTFAENSTIRLVRNQNLAGGVTIDLYTGNISSNDGTPVGSDNPLGITLPPASFDQISGWVVRIKALKNDLPNLTFYAECVDTSPCPNFGYPNRFPLRFDIAISSRGTYRDARFVMRADVPWRLPTVGVFDYVIFSEKTLDKPG